MSILMFHVVKDGGTDVHPFFLWPCGLARRCERDVAGHGQLLECDKPVLAIKFGVRKINIDTDIVWPKFAGEDIVHPYGGPEP